MTLCLPEFIHRYFAAEAAGNSAELAATFAPDDAVRDEGRDIRGAAAIAAWIDAAKARYGNTTEPLRTFEADGRIHVIARVTGNFPGSPIELDHRFTQSRLGITSLEIG